MATGALFAVKIGQLVVALVRQHLENIQQARLLQQQAEIITPLVSELVQRMRSRAVPASSKDSVFRAINCVGQALKVSSPCRAASLLAVASWDTCGCAVLTRFALSAQAAEASALIGTLAPTSSNLTLRVWALLQAAALLLKEWASRKGSALSRLLAFATSKTFSDNFAAVSEQLKGAFVMLGTVVTVAKAWPDEQEQQKALAADMARLAVQVQRLGEAARRDLRVSCPLLCWFRSGCHACRLRLVWC
jgi:hypothetical protein